jgi:hypothetical protein
VLQAQASHLALLHRRYRHGVKKDDLRAWLSEQAASQARVWRAAYDAARR